MSIENKPAERLITAFQQGRFGLPSEEIFAPVEVKPIETPEQFRSGERRNNNRI